MLDLNSDGYVDLKEFVHGFFKVYYSNLDTKIKMAFDMYYFSLMKPLVTISIKTVSSRRKTLD